MTNHPNRQKQEPNFDIDRVEIARVGHNVIEWRLAAGDCTWEFHANRYASFHGRHRVGARQVDGGASSPWRDRDIDLLRQFVRRYPNADVRLVDRLR